MLTPGRGLRGAALSDMARQGGSGGWAVATKLGEVDIGTGTLPTAPERRQVRVNGAPASVNSLSEWLSVLWLTPAMDRLFTGSAGERRRFLDRLVLALEPGHAHHSARYEAAMRARNKLLADDSWDDAWLASLEAGDGRARRRDRGGARADRRGAGRAAGRCARRRIRARRDRAGRLGRPATSPRRSAPTARATRRRAAPPKGPHRQDLAVLHRAKQMPAAQSSTGEQKALLLGLVLAHAELVTDAAASRRSCCSTRSPPTSTPSAARRCSRASKDAVRCG